MRGYHACHIISIYSRFRIHVRARIHTMWSTTGIESVHSCLFQTKKMLCAKKMDMFIMAEVYLDTETKGECTHKHHKAKSTGYIAHIHTYSVAISFFVYIHARKIKEHTQTQEKKCTCTHTTYTQTHGEGERERARERASQRERERARKKNR